MKKRILALLLSCAMVVGAVELLHALPEGEDGTVFRLVTDADLSALPEDTSLRRKVKELMLMGGHVGVGRGVLARAFR